MRHPPVNLNAPAFAKIAIVDDNWTASTRRLVQGAIPFALSTFSPDTPEAKCGEVLLWDSVIYRKNWLLR